MTNVSTTYISYIIPNRHTLWISMTLKRYRQMITKIACLCCLCMISCWYPIFRSLMICIFQELELCPGYWLWTYRFLCDNWRSVPLSRSCWTQNYPFTYSVFSGISPFLYLACFHLPLNLFIGQFHVKIFTWLLKSESQRGRGNREISRQKCPSVLYFYILICIESIRFRPRMRYI